MSTCTLKERLHSAAIGFVVAVVLQAFCWGASMLTWATSTTILTSAPNRTDQRMMERSALLAAVPASLPVGR